MQDVVPDTSIYQVLARTTDCNVVAVPTCKDITPANAGVGRRNARHLVLRQGGVSAIAQQDVVAGTAVDRIIACTAEGDVVACASGDGVVTDGGRVGRCDVGHLSDGSFLDLAGITDQDVIVVATADRSAPSPRAPPRRRRSSRRLRLRSIGRHRRDAATDERDDTGVADDDVAAVVAREAVGADSTEEDIVTAVTGDHVAAAIGRVGRGDARDLAAGQEDSGRSRRPGCRCSRRRRESHLRRPR